MPLAENVDCLAVREEIYRSITGNCLSKLNAKSFAAKDLCKVRRTMCLTHTASVFEFLFSNNSEFYAMSVNGGNCFVDTLSLFAKSTEVF